MSKLNSRDLSDTSLLPYTRLSSSENISGVSSYLGGEGEYPSSSTTELDAPEGAAAGGERQKPGEFVRKEEVLVDTV